MTPPTAILDAYAWTQHRVEQHLPYVFGGGHNPTFSPSGSPAGYDCSGLAGGALHAGGMLSQPADTHALERWGLSGEGQFFTLWVLNDATVEHCVMQFKLPAHTQHHFVAARHTGTFIEWYPATEPASWIVQGFHPRRRR